MSTGPIRTSNRILFYTLLTLIAITILMAIYSYFAQIALFKEKELYKLDCIVNAVSFKIDGDEHAELMRRFPGREKLDELKADSIYQKYQQMLSMTVEMKEISSDMYTLVFDSTQNNFVFGVSSGEQPLWMHRYSTYPSALKEKYSEGGIIDIYEDSLGSWLSAFYPVKNMNGETVAVLQVDEELDVFRSRARNEVIEGIILTLVIILIVGALMFFSVKNILMRQEKLADEKQQVENLRKELMANVSHDLRTPLASIHGYIETILMKKDDLDEERLNKYLNTTLRSTEKLKTLVDELFELSKLESREKEINLEEINLGDLIHDVANTNKIEAQRREIKLTPIIPLDLPQVTADVALIDRALQNLIHNAMKFCDPGCEITISASQKKNLIEITIADDGPGIPPEELPHIFERFHKGTHHESGTGLGLAIVKGIFELHEAPYNVKSKEGSGTRFIFSLPVAKKDNASN